MPVFSAIGRLRRIKNRKRNPLNRHPLMNRRLISFQLSTGTSTGARRHGYTAAQRYFLAYGQIWCQNVTDQEARKRVLTDSHSPGRPPALPTYIHRLDDTVLLGRRKPPGQRSRPFIFRLVFLPKSAE